MHPDIIIVKTELRSVTELVDDVYDKEHPAGGIFNLISILDTEGIINLGS